MDAIQQPSTMTTPPPKFYVGMNLQESDSYTLWENHETKNFVETSIASIVLKKKATKESSLENPFSFISGKVATLIGEIWTSYNNVEKERRLLLPLQAYFHSEKKGGIATKLMQVLKFAKRQNKRPLTSDFVCVLVAANGQFDLHFKDKTTRVTDGTVQFVNLCELNKITCGPNALILPIVLAKESALEEYGIDVGSLLRECDYCELNLPRKVEIRKTSNEEKEDYKAQWNLMLRNLCTENYKSLNTFAKLIGGTHTFQPDSFTQLGDIRVSK